MATKEAIGIMREKVHARLAAASAELMARHGLTPSQYVNLSKDPDIATVRTLEAIAGDLEAVNAANSEVAEAEPDEKTGLLGAVLDGNADTVKARIAEVESVDDLRAIHAIETARGAKARKTVLAAVEARIAALEG
ncbi:MAG TPA: hypothetical protein VGM37_02505 [Armatimonadota bacterium]|jgi:hypothetical protein